MTNKSDTKIQHEHGEHTENTENTVSVSHGHYHSPDEKKKQLNRLSKAAGHLQHVRRMIENDEDYNSVYGVHIIPSFSFYFNVQRCRIHKLFRKRRRF